MTQLDQVRKLDELGMDFAGFILYPKSHSYEAKHIKGEQLKKGRFRLGKVGVFVNSSYDEVMRHVDEYGLDMVQLHGDETPILVINWLIISVSSKFFDWEMTIPSTG
jgi:phosphoribosylanthranilate isomerase